MSKTKRKVVGVCPMCGETKELIQSHIIPALVIRALKEHGSGRLRRSQSMDRIVQDGKKPYLLCRPCDNRHSGSETKFNTRLYLPLLNGDHGPIEYGQWLKNFIIFTTYKSLICARKDGELDMPGIEPFLPAIDQAIETFNRYLTGERADDGGHTHYLTIFPNNLSSANDDVPTLALQALGGHVHSEVLITDADPDEPASCFHYVLMPQLIFWTYLEPKEMPFPRTYLDRGGRTPDVVADSGTLLLNQPREVGIHGGIAQRLHQLLHDIRQRPRDAKTIASMQKAAQQLSPGFMNGPTARFMRLAAEEARRRGES